MAEQLASMMFTKKDGVKYQILTIVDPDSDKPDFGVRNIIREVG